MPSKGERKSGEGKEARLSLTDARNFVSKYSEEMKQPPPSDERLLSRRDLRSAIASPPDRIAQLMTKYHIQYDPHRRQIPGHEGMSQAIAAISKVRFKDYRLDVKSKPKGTAQYERMLVKKVENLRLTDRFERFAVDSFRFTLDALELASFGAEVSWRPAGARIYSYDKFPYFKDRKETCTCSGVDGNNECLQLLFSAQIDEELKISDWGPHLKSLRPDLVYGLSKSNAILKLLGAPWKSESHPSEHSFAFEPFADTPNSPIFPFLILESRSEILGDFPQVTLADCIAIHGLLKIQHALAVASRGVVQNIGNPFVWFLSSVGAQMHLSGAYIDEKQSIPEFHILDLWSGHIDLEDHALQLLLIIDLIVEWAREVYRIDVIKALLSQVADRESILQQIDAENDAESDFPSRILNMTEHDSSDDTSDFGDSKMKRTDDNANPRLEALEYFVTGGDPFIRLKSNLFYLLQPPKTLQEALNSRSIFTIRRYISRQIRSATKDDEHLLELRATGYSNREIAEILLGEASEASQGDRRAGNAHVVLPDNSSSRFLIEDQIKSPSADWISRLRLSARVHTYVIALSNTLISRWELFTLGYLVRSLILTQTPPNHKLISWRCGCGEKMSTYIHENRAGAATEMAKRLTRQPESTVVAHTSPNLLSGSATSIAPTSVRSMQRSGSIALSSFLPIGLNSSTKRTNATVAAAATAGGLAACTSRFLLLCINVSKYEIVLEQINLDSLISQSDCALFKEIRRLYEAAQTYVLSRFAMYQATKVHLTKFQLIPRQSDCRVGILKQPSVPPPDSVLVHKTYHYIPCPLEREPYLPMNDVFLHAFFDPREHTTDFWLDSLPKRLREQLVYTSKDIPAIGWGIHIEEGVNVFVLSVLILLILILTTVFCVGWAVLRHGDVQGAFTIGSYVVALEMGVLTAVFFYLQNP